MPAVLFERVPLMPSIFEGLRQQRPRGVQSLTGVDGTKTWSMTYTIPLHDSSGGPWLVAVTARGPVVVTLMPSLVPGTDDAVSGDPATA